MLKHPAKPELDVADVAQLNFRGTGHRPQSLLPHHAPSPTEQLRSPAFPPLPSLQPGKRGKRQGRFAPLVMEGSRNRTFSSSDNQSYCNCRLHHFWGVWCTLCTSYELSRFVHRQHLVVEKFLCSGGWGQRMWRLEP